MAKYSHVRLAPIRAFLKKHKSIFEVKKIMTGSKETLINAIEARLNDAPEAVQNEWNTMTARPETKRPIKNKESPAKAESLPQRKGASRKPPTTVKRSRKQSAPQRNKKTVPQQIQREELKRGQSFMATRAREELKTGKKKPTPKPGKTYLKRNISGAKGDIRSSN